MSSLSRFRKFFKKEYGAHILMLSNERHRPGMLLDTDWRLDLDVDGSPVFGKLSGYAWEWLGRSEKEFKVVSTDAGLVQGTVKDEFGLGGTVSLPQFGLELGADLTDQFDVALTITGLTVRVFERYPLAFDLKTALRGLEKSNKAHWKAVKDDAMIFEAYHVESMRAKFSGAAGVSAKAAFKKAGLTSKGDVKLTWKGSGTLEMTGPATVPLAIYVERVKPFLE